MLLLNNRYKKVCLKLHPHVKLQRQNQVHDQISMSHLQTKASWQTCFIFCRHVLQMQHRAIWTNLSIQTDTATKANAKILVSLFHYDFYALH